MGVKEKIFDNYARFSPIPWFIGEYGANNQPRLRIKGDLEDMQTAAEQSTDFLGTTFFQFQTAYWMGSRNGPGFGRYGLFSLGETTLADEAAMSLCVLSFLAHPLPQHRFAMAPR